MINVIRHGDKRKIVCPECNCIFTYQEEDVETRRVEIQFTYKRIINCPDCSFEIEVSE